MYAEKVTLLTVSLDLEIDWSKLLLALDQKPVKISGEVVGFTTNVRLDGDEIVADIKDLNDTKLHRSELLSIVKSAASQYTTDEITEDTLLEDIGDSLDLVELVMIIEEKTDTNIPDEEFGSLTTVGLLITYIQGEL